jgi:hypothetical protein
MVQDQCCQVLLGHSTTFQGAWVVFSVNFYFFCVGAGTSSTSNPIGLPAPAHLENENSEKFSNAMNKTVVTVPSSFSYVDPMVRNTHTLYKLAKFQSAVSVDCCVKR